MALGVIKNTSTTNTGAQSNSNFFTPIENVEPIIGEGISRIKLPDGHLIIAAIYNGDDKFKAASYTIFNDVPPAI